MGPLYITNETRAINNRIIKTVAAAVEGLLPLNLKTEQSVKKSADCAPGFLDSALTATHTVSAVQALVTSAVSHGRMSAAITRWGIPHHLGQVAR
jgi:hypothetical protein